MSDEIKFCIEYMRTQLGNLIWLFICIVLGFSKMTYANDWLQYESENFIVVYESKHQHLVPKVKHVAEKSLQRLQTIFNYQPSEAIYILMRDSRDYGGGSATVLPRNMITLEVAPYNHGKYESTRFDDYIQWLLSHEIVHIVMGDQSSPRQAKVRSWFGKVEPVKDTPMTLPFSILTNEMRMTPTWYQEGIAVFFETWLNGGFGRVLGSYDEMYFRALVHEDATFYQSEDVDFDLTTYLQGTASYLYGTRFMTYITIRFGLDKLMQWVRLDPEQDKLDIKQKFEVVFASKLEDVWNEFIQSEKVFQKQNLKQIERYPLSNITAIAEPLGWVTAPYRAGTEEKLYFANFRPHDFVSIDQLDLRSGELTEIQTLATPGLANLTTLASDPVKQTLFYTTHNNMGYRDLWMVDTVTKKNKRIYQDARIGSLAVNAQGHSLWGIQIHGSRSFLVELPYPYNRIQRWVAIPEGHLISHMQIHPSQSTMAATLREPNGSQSIILSDLSKLKETRKLSYITVYNKGNPEHPSFSPDGRGLYWNAYTSGVSNIFRAPLAQLDDIQAISNVQTGLFHPLALDNKRVFAFRFTVDGFQPVLINNRAVSGLAAIQYRGQQVLARHPELMDWRLRPDSIAENEAEVESRARPYNSFSELEKTAFIPTVTAYSGQTVLGFHYEMRDPIRKHRLYTNFGLSQGEDQTDWHWSSHYSYLDIHELNIAHLPSSFYDLANNRKVSRVKDSVSYSYKKWWQFDRPRLTEQWFNAGWYELKEDDFGNDSSEQIVFLGTNLSKQNRRKTIGNVEFEKGYEFTADLTTLALADDKSIDTTMLSSDLHLYRPLFHPHNIVRTKLSAGKAWGDFIADGRFYFGGVGDQILDANSNRRYREPERFAGLGDNVQIADKFTKFSLENSFPPFNVAKSLHDNLYLRKVDLSLFSQALQTNFEGEESRFYNLGLQVNGSFTSFHVLDSTLSIGFARARRDSGEHYNEAFIYLKLFRN